MKNITKTFLALLTILCFSSSAFAQLPMGNFSGLWVENKPSNDITPSLTGLTIINRGTGGVNYGWTWQTAAVGGGYGINPNAMELWEYPEAGGLCCRPRIIIMPSKNISGAPNPLVIDENGNVGIGGASNTGPYKLAVEGKIGAREIKVTLANPWADYVFDKKYKLRSIYDVEKYIQENKHLPGIPSAQEVKDAGGVELGDMNVKLLEKIEELTLYVIQLKKENDEIAKQIKSLQGKK